MIKSQKNYNLEVRVRDFSLAGDNIVMYISSDSRRMK